MKKIAIFAIITAVFLGPGCKREELPPKQNGDTAVDPDRESFYRETQTRLDELSREIADLKQQVRQAPRDRQDQYEDKIDSLQKKEVDLRENLEQIKTASKEAWADLKPRLKSALAELTKGLGNAISEFRFTNTRTQPSE